MLLLFSILYLIFTQMLNYFDNIRRKFLPGKPISHGHTADIILFIGSRDISVSARSISGGMDSGTPAANFSPNDSIMPASHIRFAVSALPL